FELRIMRASRGSAGYFQNRVEVVRHNPTCFRICPRAAICQFTVAWPYAERQGEGANAIAGNYGVNCKHATRNLLLHERVVVFAKVRMPERVVAQLETLLMQELHLEKPPLCLLTFNATVAEERASCFRCGQHAEHRPISPVRSCAAELEPNTNSTRGVDLQFAVARLDVPELRR